MRPLIKNVNKLGPSKVFERWLADLQFDRTKIPETGQTKMRNHVEENENNSLTNPGKNYPQKLKDAEKSNLLDSYWQLGWPED
jgi:hypothetical protein